MFTYEININGHFIALVHADEYFVDSYCLGYFITFNNINKIVATFNCTTYDFIINDDNTRVITLALEVF